MRRAITLLVVVVMLSFGLCGVWRTAVFERRGRKREDGESRKGRLRERRYAGALCGWGGTTGPMYDGKNFAKAHGDAILVTYNYRLISNIFARIISNMATVKGKGNTMEFNDLSKEQQEKALACKTPEEILALAKDEGYELSDEELESVNGGMMWGDVCVGVACKVCRGYKGCKCY